ncbi:disintegrin and metalloproteinase domain-containing protein 28, partial [Nephila pilipes]
MEWSKMMGVVDSNLYQQEKSGDENLVKFAADIDEIERMYEGSCPNDLFKKNGAICSGGLGYCFQGQCPLLKTQCQNIWGKDGENANAACYERLNILGTPNGNCGYDNKGDIRKCAI